MAKSTRSRAARKPQKPHPDFPLFAHQNGRWAKKVRGQFCYFGTWADDTSGERALRLWNDQKDELLAGERQTSLAGTATAGLPLHRLVNDYLNAKRQHLESGRITPRTFGEYHATGARITQALGRNRQVASLSPKDFGTLYDTLARTRGLVALGNEITRVKMIFKWGFDEGLIETPVRFGTTFRKPTREEIDRQRARSDDEYERTFSADELRRILDAVADRPALHAMVLLGVNCAYGQSDCARLKIKSVDLESGWARSRRPKTGAERGARLWPETTTALRAALQSRPEPVSAADAGLLFLTSKGQRYIRESTGVNDKGEVDPRRWMFRTDLIGEEFGRVLRALGINGRRGFYNLRHTASIRGRSDRRPHGREVHDGAQGFDHHGELRACRAE